MISESNRQGKRDALSRSVLLLLCEREYEVEAGVVDMATGGNELHEMKIQALIAPSRTTASCRPH